MKKLVTIAVVLMLIFSPSYAVNAASPTITVYRGSDVLKFLADMGMKFTLRGSGSSCRLIRVENKTYSLLTPAKPSTTTTTPTSVPTSTVSASAMQSEMLAYINTERAKVNAAPLVLDAKLSNGAYLKSQDMAINAYFDHNSPTYGSPFDMMKSLGITYQMAGENIAKDTSVKGAHEAFMNSPGHKSNILNNGFHKIGLGFYQSGSYLYVTQWFTK